MGKGLFLTLGQMPVICWWTLRQVVRGDWRGLPRRLCVLGAGLVIFLLLQCLHWWGFLLDEFLFRGYRRVPVRRPLMVTGVPRSGTTHLQRVLAGHEQLTAMQTWECLLAPSITERHLWRGLGRLCRPLAGALGRLSPSFVREMDGIHRLALTEPEEDMLALLSVNACFLLVVVFPREAALWRLSRFDTGMAPARRRAILGFYRRLIQKHLYYHGPEKRYLAKNPGFLSWLDSLEEAFPDADFVLCRRDPEQVLPSQLSALAPGWRLVHGVAGPTPDFQWRVAAMLANYYRDLEGFHTRHGRCREVPMHRLTSDLEGTVRQVLAGAGLPLTPAYRRVLEDEAARARTWRSPHRYRREASAVRWSEVAPLFPGRQAT